MTISHRHSWAFERTTRELRAALAPIREEAAMLWLAGILCDSGVSLDAFEDLAATSSIMREALAKARAWRAIPVSLERASERWSATTCPRPQGMQCASGANAASSVTLSGGENPTPHFGICVAIPPVRAARATDAAPIPTHGVSGPLLQEDAA